MLENINYCPVLHARIAEMKALFQLPAISKDRLFPLIVARPWPNANRLHRTWEKIAEAFGQRRFALDLDEFKRGTPTSRPAGAEFDALFDPANGWSNYYQLVEQISGAVPVLRSQNTRNPAALQAELANVLALDRGLVVRINHDTTADVAGLIAAVRARIERFVVFVDAGWSPDVLGRAGWSSGVLRNFDDPNEPVEIVVCGSSFPEEFTGIDERGELRVEERAMFETLVRQHNHLDLKYGDWASTRPPRESTPMTPVPRIDLALQRSWVCFRQTEEETYSDIARRVIADHEWSDGLSIWATYTIECTANELPGMIRSQAVAASVRVNMHLYRQAHFGEITPTGDADEPFTDD